MTFTWARTTPDSHHAFTAHDRDEPVGGIRREEGGPAQGDWYWSCWGVHRGRAEAPEIQPLSGRVLTRDEAIDALGAAWTRAKAWSARTGKPLRYT